MDYGAAFRPAGRQFLIPTQSSGIATAVQASTRVAGDIAYLFYNQDQSSDVFVGFGLSAAEAQTNAVIPTSGNATTTIPIPAGTMQTFTLTPNLFFSSVAQLLPGQTQNLNANLFITPGDGV